MTGKKRNTAATPPPPRFADFVSFAESWLLPLITVRLAEANREGTYTWCTRWWAHRAVAVRIAHLHSAFETHRARDDAAAVSSYLLQHVDRHFEVILDAANGPLHRCTRTKHVAVPSLPFDPVPPEWFGPAITRAAPSGGEDEPPPLRFPSFVEFTEQWLLPVTSVRLVGQGREGNFTWCRQWWRHRAVAVRFAAVHAIFEAARRSEDRSQMSSLFVSHIDPQMRKILDAAKGPLHRCTPERHTDSPGLPVAAVPHDWFEPPGTITAVEDAGFGPDFRILNDLHT
ncbi:DUF4913 domain-containing protein [Nocardia amamiensis]|uniref:DUF4913 domain-containing protein n=1 Tax=Nocardia amamiensis TaxID=404578 RepID=A0ABS0D1W3_9NOCA|nr:DUF4913 domain-containing protein [Nocardia amamiensis]MBF6302781.1 DUF4913 domain-containing protein [Nocardia amamiensis]